MEISVVIPIYNELENLPYLLDEVTKTLKNSFKTYEIIFVNDGSTDGSYELLEKIKLSNSFTKVFHILENSGQSAAIDLGFKKATGDLILLMDGDLQTDPNDVTELIKYIPEYDFVNGCRIKRSDGLKRDLASKIGNGFRNFITGDRDAKYFND